MSVLLPAVEAVFSAILPSLLPELYDPHEHQDDNRDYDCTKETEQNQPIKNATTAPSPK